MDETFIKMCKEATEIQERWEPKKGDMIYYVKKKLIEPVTMADKELKNRFGYHYKQMGFWLPRQEDLQEIYYKETQFPSFEGLLEDFNLFIESPDTIIQSHHNFNTIWLEFVMYQIYGKEWNGTTWEAI